MLEQGNKTKIYRFENCSESEKDNGREVRNLKQAELNLNFSFMSREVL